MYIFLCSVFRPAPTYYYYMASCVRDATQKDKKALGKKSTLTLFEKGAHFVWKRTTVDNFLYIRNMCYGVLHSVCCISR